MEKMERDLRDMMQRQTDAVDRTPTATRALVRRAQLRRVGTVALTGTFVLVLVLGGIGVGRSLLRDSAFPPAKPAPSGAHLSFLVPCIGCYPDSPSEPGLSTIDPEGSIGSSKRTKRCHPRAKDPLAFAESWTMRGHPTVPVWRSSTGGF